MNNAIMLWAFLNGIIGIIIFIINFNLSTTPQERKSKAIGLKTSAIEIVKTLGLALCVTGIFYIVLFSIYAIFHTDYRFVFTAGAAVNTKR